MADEHAEDTVETPAGPTEPAPPVQPADRFHWVMLGVETALALYLLYSAYGHLRELL